MSFSPFWLSWGELFLNSLMLTVHGKKFVMGPSIREGILLVFPETSERKRESGCRLHVLFAIIIWGAMRKTREVPVAVGVRSCKPDCSGECVTDPHACDWDGVYLCLHKHGIMKYPLWRWRCSGPGLTCSALVGLAPPWECAVGLNSLQGMALLGDVY